MNKEFLKKCWEDKRLHSLMVLIIWIIVLTLMMGFVFIMNAINRNNNTTPVETNNDTAPSVLSYYDKLNNLISNDFEYTYIITKDDEKIKFEGTNSNGIIEGYKESLAGIIKYKIKEQKVYQILVDQEVEITNLYENIDTSLLDLNYVVGTLKQFSENDVIITEEEMITTYNYKLTKDGEELEIIVTENENAIEKITINRNSEIYELTYKVK